MVSSDDVFGLGEDIPSFLEWEEISEETVPSSTPVEETPEPIDDASAWALTVESWEEILRSLGVSDVPAPASPAPLEETGPVPRVAPSVLKTPVALPVSPVFDEDHEVEGPRSREVLAALADDIVEPAPTRSPAAPSPVGLRAFVRALGPLLVLGVVLRLLLAPLTSLDGDMGVWWQASQRAMEGVGLYTFTGFSYPPLFGYWAIVLGMVTHWLGGTSAALGHLFPAGQQIGQQIFGPVVTTPWATALYKLPMMVADVATAYLVWRIAGRLGYDAVRQRRAALWWFLNPLVIMTTAVQGQIDSLAAFAIALGVLATLEETWWLAGVAVSIGVAVKLAPGLVALPFAGYLLARSRERWRSLAGFVAGGVVGALVLIGPEAGHGLVTDVFTRANVDSAIGGIGISGLLRLSSLSGVYSWATVHFVGLNRSINVLQFLVALAGGLWCWRRGRDSTLVRVVAAVVLFTLMINVVANPQYLVWIVPMMALGAQGSTSADRWWRGALLTVGISGPIYLYALNGVRKLFAPMGYYLGWPSLTSAYSEHRWLLQRWGPHWLPATLSGKITLLASIAVTLSFVAVLVALTRPDPAPVTVAVEPLRWRSPGVTVTSLLTVALEVVAVAGPLSVGSPQLSAQISALSSGQHVVTVSGPASSTLTVSAFPINPAREISRVEFYDDSRYPYAYSSAATTLGVEQQLVNVLSHTDPGVGVHLVNATQLASFLASDPAPETSLVVDVSGTLPNLVWGAHGAGGLLPWIGRGGRLAFSGGDPGHYSVAPGNVLYANNNPSTLAPGVTTVANTLLLPGQIVGSSNDLRSPASVPSGWASALGLTYAVDTKSFNSDAVLRRHGANLGFLQGTTSSIVYVPQGLGGVLAFAGDTQPSSVTAVASDLARLVGSNWFAHVGPYASAPLSTSPTLLRAGPLGAGQFVQVIGVTASRPLYLWREQLP
jgi:hypothetical protein